MLKGGLDVSPREQASLAMGRNPSETEGSSAQSLRGSAAERSTAALGVPKAIERNS